MAVASTEVAFLVVGDVVFSIRNDALALNALDDWLHEDVTQIRIFATDIAWKGARGRIGQE
jgi:hypothetical protein